MIERDKHYKHPGLMEERPILAVPDDTQMPTNFANTHDDFPSELRRKRRRRTSSGNIVSSCDITRLLKHFFRILVALLFLRADAFHCPSSTRWKAPPIKTSSTRFVEPPTKSTQEKVCKTRITRNTVKRHNTNATASNSNYKQYIDEQEIEEETFGAVTRRDAFRYCTGLASAVWVTGLAFSHTDPSTKKPLPPKTSPLPLPAVSPPAPLPQTAQPPTVEPVNKLEPVNLTEVASQTNINVTMNCEKMCVSIDSSNMTFTKVEKAKTPKWLPSWLAPKSQVVKKIPNSELLVAATVAGSAVEMVRTGLLYPVQTVKVRLQADRDQNLAQQYSGSKSPSISEQLTTLGSNIREKVNDGNLYAGISPALLVAVPATGIYYGIRDVTKRLLFMTPLDSTWIAVGGALVGDVVSLCFRVPSDALRTRLQAQQNTNSSAGDWLGDSVRTLPMIILTDLPYLISKIVLNKYLIQGNMSVSEYALFAAFASVVAGFLTTPFDVARTRILLNQWPDEPTEEEDEDSAAISSSNPGNSVLRTMVQITKEGEGGIANLFSGWLERVVYLGIGRAWLEPIQLIGYIGIRDAVLLEWF